MRCKEWMMTSCLHCDRLMPAFVKTIQGEGESTHMSVSKPSDETARVVRFSIFFCPFHLFPCALMWLRRLFLSSLAPCQKNVSLLQPKSRVSCWLNEALPRKTTVESLKVPAPPTRSISFSWYERLSCQPAFVCNKELQQI